MHNTTVAPDKNMPRIYNNSIDAYKIYNGYYKDLNKDDYIIKNSYANLDYNTVIDYEFVIPEVMMKEGFVVGEYYDDNEVKKFMNAPEYIGSIPFSILDEEDGNLLMQPNASKFINNYYWDYESPVDRGPDPKLFSQSKAHTSYLWNVIQSDGYVARPKQYWSFDSLMNIQVILRDGMN